MKPINGFEVLDIVKSKYKGKISILICSSFDDEDTIVSCYRNGASGYINKASNLSELYKALDELWNKKIYISDEHKSKIITGLSSKDQALETLTVREKEILQLICNEYSSSEIAEKLFISVHTVNNHRKSILYKTNSSSLVSLLKYSLKNGYLDP